MRRGAAHAMYVFALILGLTFGMCKTVLAEANYLTFTGTQPFTINTGNNSKNWNGKLEYSTDASNWTEWNGEIINSINNVIYFRGTDNNVITGQNYVNNEGNYTYAHRWVISSDGKVACSGDIRALLHYPNMDSAPMWSYCFEGLFFGCTTLTKAPELPATIMDADCYLSMFEGCTSLKEAPELPAIELATGCYSAMFKGCTSLNKAPELPATTMSFSCYAEMFYGCTNLTVAPKLPATTLAVQCYEGMFRECTGLIEAPKLPATTLARGCYQDMFEGCTSLKKAPELPATTMNEWCYGYMFNGCKNLTEAPKLPATTLAEACYYAMFCDCTSLKEAPELPATTMFKSCYNHMFSECSSLTTAPKLPATTLASLCYYCMFSYCTSLKVAPELPATELTEWCYESMFKSCTSLKTAPELPATTLAERCYATMFSGCTSLTELPELPAKTLPNRCYYRMFRNCSNLGISENKDDVFNIEYRIPNKGAGTAANDALTEMFDSTGGPFTGTPEINRTYYLRNPSHFYDSEQKVEMQSLDQVPPELRFMFESIDQIKAQLTNKLIHKLLHFNNKQIIYMNIKLMVSTNGGRTWVEATKENFPVGGIRARLPFPAGTNGKQYRFVVSHMYTCSWPERGWHLGQIDLPPVTWDDNGLWVTFRALSPVAIAWEKIDDATDDLPQTGDDSHFLLWSALAVVCIAAVTIVMKKRVI